MCAELTAGGYACHPPVFLRGMVFDSASNAAIEGSEVLAFDDQATAVTDVAITDAAGNYELDVPVPRDDNGAPVADYVVTLRASAADYQTFPGGLRTALPIASAEAMEVEGGWAIQSALTDIALIALPAGERGRPSISGHVLAGDQSAACSWLPKAPTAGSAPCPTGPGATRSSTCRTATLRSAAYAAGVQLTPQDVTVSGGR